MVLLGDGDGTFQAPIQSPLSASIARPYWVRLGDLSSDGALEAAITGVNGALLVFKGRGDGSFEEGLPIGLRPDGRPLGLALGDFDENDRLDIACSRGKIFLNDGQFFDPTTSLARQETWPGRVTTSNSGTNGLITPRLVERTASGQRAGLFINEIMAANEDFLVVNGTALDWLELYNNTARPQNLAGWALASVPPDESPSLWFFPSSASVPAHGHLAVFCKNHFAAPNGLATTFALSADGETVVLFAPGLTEVDRVSFPPMPPDVSYARFLDGERFFTYNPAPTLGEANMRPGNLDPAELHRITIPATGSPLRLSELMAANATTITDEPGQFEDWIELLNTANSTVCLDGLGLTKDAFDLTQAWPLPNFICLTPGQRLVVFCDEDLSHGPLHASFKLTRAGLGQ